MLIDYVLSDARFYCNITILLINYYYRNIINYCYRNISIINIEIFYRSNRGLFSVASRVCITVKNSPDSPNCLDEAMKHGKRPLLLT